MEYFHELSEEFCNSMTDTDRPSVGLFVTCVVDLFRPNVGFAAVKLLREANCQVEVPLLQTCCGQPAYNSGDRKDCRDIARLVIQEFEKYDYVVVPSGSCASMMARHYGSLFQDDEIWVERAQSFAKKVHELMSFLFDVRKVEKIDGTYEGTITYHDSCSGLRELGIKNQPRELLRSLRGLKLSEMKECEACCGFGGTFSVKYPEISDAIVGRKTANIAETDAELLVAGDLGCLINMVGKLSREGRKISGRHAAEILAGLTSEPPIGTPQKKS